VTEALAKHDVAIGFGDSGSVGVGGITLGGGIGFLVRKYGMTIDAVLAAEVVTADGRHRRVDATHEPELFWALRGGGGNFGVVTALEFSLYPVEAVYAGMMFWPWEDGERILSRWVEVTREAPEELTSMARLMQIPDLPMVPELLRGRQIVAINAAYLGDEQDGAAALAPLRELRPEADLFAMMPPVGLSGLHGDPEEPVPVASDTLIVDELPQPAIDAVMAKAGPGSGSALLMAELRHLGGAAGRLDEGHGALGRIDGDYVLFAGGLAADPQMAAAVRRDASGLVEALRPFGSDRRYLNFTEYRTDTRAGYSHDAYTRLQLVRQKADPEAIFRANHEIA
jgi:FAD/FMN-containing dehydrogenase